MRTITTRIIFFLELPSFSSGRLAVAVLFYTFALTGCSSHPSLTLMPTPVLYQNADIDPFAHLTTAQKSTITRIFYATNRTPSQTDNGLKYTNAFDPNLRFGQATIRMGEQDFIWEDLYAASLSTSQVPPVPLSLENLQEQAVAPVNSLRIETPLPPGMQEVADAINLELAKAVDKEIMVYVHGTRVDFANAAILTAEIDHFAGRDFVGLAFAWPSHQNILSYVSGTDVRRAEHSSAALQSLLMFLADYTTAEHINILSYSAGGKVTSKALMEMRQTFSDMNPTQLRDAFRIGVVLFAAADVEVGIFLDRMPAISDLSQQVVATVSDNDNVLEAAKRIMGGEVRAGNAEAENREEGFIQSNTLLNVEIIDVSIGQDIRGFDIIGHHYWYRHPWMSSDIIFLMRTDLPPSRRGLTPSEVEGIWYLSADYPEKIKKAAALELHGQW